MIFNGPKIGAESDPNSLQIQTLRKKHIPNLLRKTKDPRLMPATHDLIASLFPESTAISSLTDYNCYGLVFASRRTCVLDYAAVDQILEEDGYKSLPWDPSAWQPGDIVLYRRPDSSNIEHVGIIACITPDLSSGNFKIDVLSAWGEDGEYRHPIDKVPEAYGSASDVVSRRTLCRS